MPVRGTCLLFDTPLKEALFDVVEFAAYDRISKGKSASLVSIYRDLRKSGIEVDLPTVGEIYNAVLPRHDAYFDSTAQIDDIVGRSYQQAIDELVNLNDLIGEKQIGEMKPGQSIAKFILKALSSNLIVDAQTKSVMKKMEDGLRAGVQRKLAKLGKKPSRSNLSLEELIEESLDLDSLNVQDVNGQANSMSDLFNELRNEIADASDQVRYMADPFIVDQYNEYIKNLENASYKLLFRRKDALTVRNEAMKRAGFGKKLANGKTIIDWVKLSGESRTLSEIRRNAEMAFTQAGYSPQVVTRLMDTLQDEFIDLQADIMERAENELLKREKNRDRDYKPKKSDLKRLIELNHLEVFSGAHNQLIYDIIGVDDLKKEDLDDIEQLTRVASDLSVRIATSKDQGGYGLVNDVFASREFQRLQRHIDNIVNRNIDNKTRLLSVMSAIRKFLDLMLSGLLAMPITITQNILSGMEAVMSGTRARFDGDWQQRSKQALKIYWSMLKHVTATGQSYGEEIGSFATQELFVNSLQFKKDLSPSGIAKNFLTAATIPIRIGLLAFDSANKVALTNKTFYNAISNSLLQRGYTKQQAAEFMNTMIYGQQFEDAKKLAKEMIDRNNSMLDPKFRSKASDAEVTTLANDIVKANLNFNEAIGPDILEAALKSSYHVAGLGLGHEPNNILSRGVKNLRDTMKRKQDSLIAQRDWKGLAEQKFYNLFVNAFMVRFTGGATNWLVLRLKQNLMGGLVTGGLKLALSNEIRWDNKNSLRDEIKRREDARNDIARALVGGAYTGITYLFGYLLTGGGDDGDEERLAKLKAKKGKSQKDYATIDELEQKSSVYRAIKNDLGKDRWFRAMAPDLMLIKYYTENSRSKSVGEGLLAYATRTYNGDAKFSAFAKMGQALELYAQGDSRAANGALASIIGGQFAFPMWRPYKEYYRLATNPFRDDKIEPSRFQPPTNVAEGFFGGGIAEDLGLFKSNASITMLNGVGIKAYNRFAKKGIKGINDLSGEWWNMKDKDGRILDADDAYNARKQWEKLKKQK